jgi:hypothetical protein
MPCGVYSDEEKCTQKFGNFYRGHPFVPMLYSKIHLKGCQTQIIN